MFSNARRVLSQCNTQLKVVYLLSGCIVEMDVYSAIHFKSSNIVQEKLFKLKDNNFSLAFQFFPKREILKQ